jgi:hypothetical protein
MVLGGEKGRAHEYGGKIIKQSVTLPASTDKLFDMYLDPVIHGAITGGTVKISPTVDSEFRVFDGMVYGRTIAVVPKKYIIQLWRGKDWKKEDRDSILVLAFLPDGRSGKIELTHLNVPEYDFDDVNKGWMDYYWKPWRAYLEKELKPENGRDRAEWSFRVTLDVPSSVLGGNWYDQDKNDYHARKAANPVGTGIDTRRGSTGFYGTGPGI